MMISNESMNKANLRKICLENRKNLSSAERIEKSALIVERFFREFDISQINFFHCYLPIEKFSEIDTRLILERIAREFPRVVIVVPRVNFINGEMESVRFDSRRALVRNRFDIDEPASGGIVRPEKIDIVITPLLCCDRRGFRVGYGKGFYDKFLPHCRTDCQKIGLNFFEPIEEISDADDFDVKIDYCVTPERVYKFDT